MSHLQKLVDDFKAGISASQQMIDGAIPCPWENSVPAGMEIADRSAKMMRKTFPAIVLSERV